MNTTSRTIIAINGFKKNITIPKINKSNKINLFMLDSYSCFQLLYHLLCTNSMGIRQNITKKIITLQYKF